MIISKHAMDAYLKAIRITKELAEVNAQMRPLHERALRLQDKSRLAYEEMNIRFVSQGLNPADAFRECERVANLDSKV